MAPVKARRGHGGGVGPSGAMRERSLAKCMYTLADKEQILTMVEQGYKNCDIQRALGVPESTIRGIKKRKEDLKKCITVARRFYTDNSSLRTVFSKAPNKRRLVAVTEDLLQRWVQRRLRNQRPVDAAKVQAQARSFYQDLCRKAAVKNPPAFTASNNWLAKFRERCNNFQLPAADAAATTTTTTTTTTSAMEPIVVLNVGNSVRSVYRQVKEEVTEPGDEGDPLTIHPEEEGRLRTININGSCLIPRVVIPPLDQSLINSLTSTKPCRTTTTTTTADTTTDASLSLNLLNSTDETLQYNFNGFADGEIKLEPLEDEDLHETSEGRLPPPPPPSPPPPQQPPQPETFEEQHHQEQQHQHQQQHQHAQATTQPTFPGNYNHNQEQEQQHSNNNNKLPSLRHLRPVKVRWLTNCTPAPIQDRETDRHNSSSPQSPRKKRRKEDSNRTTTTQRETAGEGQRETLTETETNGVTEERDRTPQLQTNTRANELTEERQETRVEELMGERDSETPTQRNTREERQSNTPKQERRERHSNTQTPRNTATERHGETPTPPLRTTAANQHTDPSTTPPNTEPSEQTEDRQNATPPPNTDTTQPSTGLQETPKQSNGNKRETQILTKLAMVRLENEKLRHEILKEVLMQNKIETAMRRQKALLSGINI